MRKKCRVSKKPCENVKNMPDVGFSRKMFHVKQSDFPRKKIENAHFSLVFEKKVCRKAKKPSKIRKNGIFVPQVGRKTVLLFPFLRELRCIFRFFFSGGRCSFFSE